MARTSNDHIDHILSIVNKLFPAKYLAGAVEHKGNLWRKRTDKFQTEELMDFMSYHFTSLEQKDETIAKLDAAISATDWGLVREARNILVIGNPEGIPEEES